MHALCAVGYVYININMPMETRNQRCAALLGLLQPLDPGPPSGEPLQVSKKGHWTLSHFEDKVSWLCTCGRSEPIYLTTADSERVLLPCDGVHACDVCRKELQEARSKSQRFVAWINQHRATLDSSTCLEFPTDKGFFKESCAERYSRTRRFVYEQFWRKKVQPGYYVRSSCSNPLCINPYHLCLTVERHTSLTPQATMLISELVHQKVSTSLIQQLLHERLSIELSVRSIQRIRKGITKSKSCAS